MPESILKDAKKEAEKLECDRASLIRYWLYEGHRKLEKEGSMPQSFLKSLPVSERKW